MSSTYSGREFTVEERKTGILGNVSHQAASKRLRQRHAAEFAELLAEERTSRGLPPVPQGKGAAMTVEEKIAKLQAKIDALRAQA